MEKNLLFIERGQFELLDQTAYFYEVQIDQSASSQNMSCPSLAGWFAPQSLRFSQDFKKRLEAVSSPITAPDGTRIRFCKANLNIVHDKLNLDPKTISRSDYPCTLETFAKHIENTRSAQKKELELLKDREGYVESVIMPRMERDPIAVYNPKQVYPVYICSAQKIKQQTLCLRDQKSMDRSLCSGECEMNGETLNRIQPLSVSYMNTCQFRHPCYAVRLKAGLDGSVKTDDVECSKLPPVSMEDLRQDFEHSCLGKQTGLMQALMTYDSSVSRQEEFESDFDFLL